MFLGAWGTTGFIFNFTLQYFTDFKYRYSKQYQEVEKHTASLKLLIKFENYDCFNCSYALPTLSTMDWEKRRGEKHRENKARENGELVTKVL